MKIMYYIWARTIEEFKYLIRENKLNPKECKKAYHDANTFEGLRLKPYQFVGRWPYHLKQLLLDREWDNSHINTVRIVNSEFEDNDIIPYPYMIECETEDGEKVKYYRV